MQSRLNPTDRKVLSWAAAVFVLLAVATLAFTPPARAQQSGSPSSYSYSPGGSAAAYLLLRRSGFSVQRWEEPPLRLAEFGRGRQSNEPRSMLILAEPDHYPTRPQRRALLQFLRNGGRVLFCGGSLPGFFEGVKLSDQTGGFITKIFPAELPVALARNAPAISMRPTAFWGRLDSSQLPVYGDRDKPVVVLWRIGAGELIWWAAATPLTNQGIRANSNLQLFLNTVASPGGPLHIYWDEYFHGEQSSLWAYIGRTPVRWALLQIVLLAAAVIFTFSRRSGPLLGPAPVSRLAPLEFVETLGGLYQTAGATSVALDIRYRRLRLHVLQKLGLPPAALNQDIAEAAALRLGWDREDFAQLLARAQTASHPPNVPWPRALVLTQQMQTYLHRLAPVHALHAERITEHRTVALSTKP